MPGIEPELLRLQPGVLPMSYTLSISHSLSFLTLLYLSPTTAHMHTLFPIRHLSTSCSDAELCWTETTSLRREISCGFYTPPPPLLTSWCSAVWCLFFFWVVFGSMHNADLGSWFCCCYSITYRIIKQVNQCGHGKQGNKKIQIF